MFNTYSTFGLLTSRLCLGGKSRDTFCRWILLWKGQVPPEYPYKPPGIIMITHSLPMDESLNPMWSISRTTYNLHSYHSGSVNTSAAESNVWQRHLLLSIVRTQHSGNCSWCMRRYIISNDFLSNKFWNSNQLSCQKKKIRVLRWKNLNLSRHLFILTTWNIYTTKLIKQAMMNKSPTYLDYEQVTMVSMNLILSWISHSSWKRQDNMRKK
ncbi:hypothetical protein LWI28_026768 [Acer negundo]|uniref:Uncharacterized protein n=1 Tax=Acer negundo TaxID=4023 RepID=A0AAD5NJW4_ACENE|nr:hypothetical protein LWI28_026768 [Acer negundo]